MVGNDDGRLVEGTRWNFVHTEPHARHMSHKELRTLMQYGVIFQLLGLRGLPESKIDKCVRNNPQEHRQEDDTA